MLANNHSVLFNKNNRTILLSKQRHNNHECQQSKAAITIAIKKSIAVKPQLLFDDSAIAAYK